MLLPLPVQAGGKNIPIKRSIQVEGQGSNIRVDLSPRDGSDPILNAIEVYPLGEYRSRVAAPSVDRAKLLDSIMAQFYALLNPEELVVGLTP